MDFNGFVPGYGYSKVTCDVRVWESRKQVKRDKIVWMKDLAVSSEADTGE